MVKELINEIREEIARFDTLYREYLRKINLKLTVLEKEARNNENM